VVPSDPQETSHPVSKLHKGRGRFQDHAPSSSNDQDKGIGGSAQGAPRHKRKQESPVAMVEDLGHPASSSCSRAARHQDGQEEPGDSEGRRSVATSSRPRAPHRKQPRGCARASSNVPRRRKKKEVYTSSEDGELDESEEDTDPSASDQGGHDDRQPKRRASAKDIGTSIWTTQE
jgi:hypothetical protein